MSKLIIEEYPLLVLPSLACAIGLNEAIALQQIHYWLNPRINKNYKEGYFWIYNSYEEWQKQFSFWSVRTIRRIIQSLESNGLLISNNFNLNNFDKTKWYTINYILLESLNANKSRIGQVGQLYGPDWTKEEVKLDTSYKETETTAKTTTNNSLSKISKVSNSFILSKGNSLDKTKEGERENEMLKIWNEVVEIKNETVIKLTTKREKLLNTRFKEFFNNDISEWQDFCKRITSSKFLMGEITNFKVSFDWVLKEENIIKILENNYGINNNVIAKNAIEAIENELEAEINNPIWRAAREELKKQLGEGTFKSWISKLDFKNISDQTVYFIAPTNFIKDWITTNYSEEIKRTLNTNGANIQQILIQHY